MISNSLVNRSINLGGSPRVGINLTARLNPVPLCLTSRATPKDPNNI